MRLSLLLLVAACDQGIPAADQATLPASAVQPACKPVSDDHSYAVCVVDEAGAPVPGMLVTASQQMTGEALGDGTSTFENKLGERYTDARGRAEFALTTRARGSGWHAREISRSAVVVLDGWPRAAADDTGIILIGPLRSFDVRRTLGDCHGDAWITAIDPRAKMVPMTVGGETAIYRATVGPGPFTLTINCPTPHSATVYRFLGKDIPATGIEI